MSRAAEDLYGAERSRVPVVPLTERGAGLTLDQAYRIQAANVERRLSGGARVVGHKVGVTSLAMQQQMGVHEPDSGTLLDDMVLPSGSLLATDELLTPRIEAEIGFRVGRDLTSPDVDMTAVRRAVSDAFLAIEVIDTRFTGWRIGLADSIADNASCARVVTGTMVPLALLGDLAQEELVLRVDGEPAAGGAGRAVLGHPLNPLIWLVRRLSTLGTGVRAGDLVLAGAVHASLALNAGTEVSVTSAHLPEVRLIAT